MCVCVCAVQAQVEGAQPWGRAAAAAAGAAPDAQEYGAYGAAASGTAPGSSVAVRAVFPWVASRANMLYLAARTHNCAADNRFLG